MSNWAVKATGNMTLSILDDDGFQILKVDMLRQNTMQAGLNGEHLAQTLNDLSIIAGFSEQKYEIIKTELPYPEAGMTPLPWHVKKDMERRQLSIISGNKIIAERIFPKSISEEKIIKICEVLSFGLTNVYIIPEDRE